MLHINIAYFCIFLKKTRHITWIYILATLHVSACIAYKSMYMYISQILHIMFVCLQRFSVCFVCKQSKLRKMSNLTRTQEAWLLLQIHWLIFLGSAWSSGPAATSCPNISRTCHTRHAHAQGNVHWWRALLRVLQESVHMGADEFNIPSEICGGEARRAIGNLRRKARQIARSVPEMLPKCLRSAHRE